MSFDDEPNYVLAADLPELERSEFGKLDAVELWPLTYEHEDEPDVPAELAPLRSRPRRTREEIVASSSADPLSRGDVFETKFFDRTGELDEGRRYRLLGRTAGAHNDWAVVERLPGNPQPQPLSPHETRTYRWTLTQRGREVDADEVRATGHAQALALALETAFDGYELPPPSATTPTTMAWDALAGGTVLRVKQRSPRHGEP